jgi:hypothetical protein
VARAGRPIFRGEHAGHAPGFNGRGRGIGLALGAAMRGQHSARYPLPAAGLDGGIDKLAASRSW